MVQRVQKYLVLGYSLQTWLDEDFLYTYFLWINIPSNASLGVSRGAGDIPWGEGSSNASLDTVIQGKPHEMWPPLCSPTPQTWEFLYMLPACGYPPHLSYTNTGSC